jgi:hypothetical protein
MAHSRALTQLLFLLAGLFCLQDSRSATSTSPEWATGLRGIDVIYTDGMTTLTSDDPRPFELAVTALRRQFHVVICYEDSPYTHADDVIDRRLLDPRAPPLLIPSGGKLVFSYKSSDVATVLDQLVRVRTVPDRGAHFSVIKADSLYMVVPSLVRDSTGAWEVPKSVLDAHITMPALSRGAEELLRTIVTLTAEASGRPFVFGWGPGPDRPNSPKYQVGAQDESTRSVLRRALALMAPQTGRFAWELLYDPQQAKYAMSFMYIPIESTVVTPTVGSHVMATPERDEWKRIGRSAELGQRCLQRCAAESHWPLISQAGNINPSP